MDDTSFRTLLDTLNLSWDGYRKVRKGVKKRIARHMEQLECRTIEAYLEKIEADAHERSECDLLLTVSISRFFRDRRLWATLFDEVIPRLLPHCGDTLRVWSAGCACGEEAYTFSIAWDRLGKSGTALPALDLTATDINRNSLERAKEGLYTRSSMREVSEEIETEYFISSKGGKHLHVIPRIQENITWLPHNLLTDPSPGQFHIIFLRNNLLTYYGDSIKRNALERIVAALLPAGILVTGSHEKIPVPDSRQAPAMIHPHIYKLPVRDLTPGSSGTA